MRQVVKSHMRDLWGNPCNCTSNFFAIKLGKVLCPFNVPVRIALNPALRIVSCVFSFFFFLSATAGDSGYCAWSVAALFLLFCPFITSVGPEHYLWDPQISLFNNFFIKNKSHDTIYIFKNYFTTVFSVLVFSFSNNKFNPNGPNTTLETTFFDKISYNYWGSKLLMVKSKVMLVMSPNKNQ